MYEEKFFVPFVCDFSLNIFFFGKHLLLTSYVENGSVCYYHLLYIHKHTHYYHLASDPKTIKSTFYISTCPNLIPFPLRVSK